MLGYGTITFADPESVTRVLQAAKTRHGILRIPYAAPLRDPQAIAYASMDDSARAFMTSPSVRDSVAAAAPMAPHTDTSPAYDHFFVTVERSERPPRPAKPPAPATEKLNLDLLREFDGFAGGLAQRAAAYAREDRKREKVTTKHRRN